MKKFFDKIKNYSFWISLSASVIMLLNAFGKAFGFEIENQVVEDCIMSIASLLVVFGIVTNKTSAKDKQTEESESEEDSFENNKEEQNNEESDKE